MKKFSTLAKTNIIIVVIQTVGFIFLFSIYYHTFYKSSLDQLEQSASESVSKLYVALSEFFIQPISISRTMANDGFLISYLSEDKSYKKKDFSETITKYLQGYNKIYNFDGAFLCTLKNRAHYTYDGFISSLETDKVAHNWYNRLLKSDKEFEINIDFDTTPSAKYNISLFVNHKIFGYAKHVLGITGICVHLDQIIQKIRDFEQKTGCVINIINEDGFVQLSGHSTALSNVNIYDVAGNKAIHKIVHQVKQEWQKNQNDSLTNINTESEHYVTVKYVPALSWYIVVENYMGEFYEKLRSDLIKAAIIIFIIMLSMIIFISKTIYGFEQKIAKIISERMRYFHDATRFMYSNIYEIDLTHDRFAPESRLHQFSNIPNAIELPYSQSVKLLSERVIKESMQEKFLQTFSDKNLLKKYEEGHDHISLDCEVLIDNAYQWSRYDVHLFTVTEDKSVHMYIYAKNINEERQKEIMAQTDALTQCLTRGVTEELIAKKLLANPDKQFAFFIIDIDNFKSANDTYGHIFGDACIQSFCQKIKDVFRKEDIIGRLGGDEFVVFIPFESEPWLHKKAFQLARALDHTCVFDNRSMHLSGSIGIALAPKDGTDLQKLYQHADAALYAAKNAGKNAFFFFNMSFSYYCGS